MFNKVILLGHLTRDVELRYTQGGTAIGNSAIAVTRKMTINNERREETCFIDIAFYGKTAEIANQYLKKGSKLLVWTDSNHQNDFREFKLQDIKNEWLLKSEQTNN